MTDQLRAEQTGCKFSSFGAVGDYRRPHLTLEVTIVDNVPSAPVSTEIDTYCMLVK